MSEELNELKILQMATNKDMLTVKESVMGIEQHLRQINGSVGDSKTRITVIESEQCNMKEDITKLRTDVDNHLSIHASDTKALSKWIIGIFITLVLTLIGIIATLARG